MTISFLEIDTKDAALAVSLAVTLNVTGCTISVPQLEASYRFVDNLTSSQDSPSNDNQATWLASVNEQGAILKPFRSGHLTVFANAEGDAVAFDGWVIRSVIGFGLNGPLSISGREGTRSFAFNEQETSTECDAWEIEGLTWRQTCANGRGEIVLDEDGNIEIISMSLGEGFGIVTLRVAK